MRVLTSVDVGVMIQFPAFQSGSTPGLTTALTQPLSLHTHTHAHTHTHIERATEAKIHSDIFSIQFSASEEKKEQRAQISQHRTCSDITNIKIIFETMFWNCYQWYEIFWFWSQTLHCSFTIFDYKTPIPYQETHLISHSSSYEVKEVFEQASVVLSVQVCQWSLLSDGSIRIQFCDQWPAETTAGLIPPQLQRVECVLPTHEQSTIKDLPTFKSEFWDVQ